MDQTTQDALQRLIVAGAELVVTDADHDVVFTAPLAHAWRLDPDDPDCLWLRPLAAPVAGDDETTVFSLNQCRRRALDITAAHPDGEALVIELATGQHARIQPATGAAADTLDAWDTFVGARLDAAEEQALDALEEDSWTGRYA
jgi:hypothetical protein